MPSFFVQKKRILIEAAVLIAFLYGCYYLYTSFSQDSTVSTAPPNEQLLGQNFVMFLKVVNKDRISFKDVSFLDSDLVKQLRNFSETISINDSRGRVDPFVPYASTRPLR